MQRLRLITRPTDPRPRLVVSAEVNLDKGLIAAPVATGGAVILMTADGGAGLVMSIPQAQWALALRLPCPHRL